MLERKYRFSLSKYYKFGAKFANNQTVLWIGAGTATTPKFAVVVPVKFCKKAVWRNRTKRLVAQSLNQLAKKVKPGYYKILITDNFSKLEQTVVTGKIKKILLKAGVLENGD